MTVEQEGPEVRALRVIVEHAEDIGGKLPAQRCRMIADIARAALAGPAPSREFARGIEARLRDAIEHLLADDDLIKSAIQRHRHGDDTATDLCARFDELRAALASSQPSPATRGWREAAVKLAKAMVSSGTECSMCGCNFIFGEDHAADCPVPVILDTPISARTGKEATP